jgi:hypothetical protein
MEKETQNFEITIDNYTYTIEYKFNLENLDYKFLKMKSKKNTDNEEIHFIIVNSLSECGMWRLCAIEQKYRNNEDGFFFYKGANYTMSTFIILELQIFINTVIDDIPLEQNNALVNKIISTGLYFRDDEDIMKRIDNIDKNNNIGIGNYDCMNKYTRCLNDIIKTKIEPEEDLYEDGNNNNNDEYELIGRRNIIDNFDFDSTSINFFSKYNYKDSIANNKPVDIIKWYQYKKLSTQKDKEDKFWPVDSSLAIDRTINFGNTNIKIEGNIYTTIIKKKNTETNSNNEHEEENGKHILYFMIFSGTIEVPEKLKKLNLDSKIYKFNEENITIVNEIIPLYIIPYNYREKDESVYTVKSLGLYPIYSEFFYKKKINRLFTSESLLDMAKILNYISQCPQNYQMCGTQYKLNIDTYKNIPFFNELKDRTLSIINNNNNEATLGGKNKTRRYKKTKNSNKRKSKKSKRKSIKK